MLFYFTFQRPRIGIQCNRLQGHLLHVQNAVILTLRADVVGEGRREVHVGILKEQVQDVHHVIGYGFLTRVAQLQRRQRTLLVTVQHAVSPTKTMPRPARNDQQDHANEHQTDHSSNRPADVFCKLNINTSTHVHCAQLFVD